MGWVNFRNFPHDRSSPAGRFEPITPSDTVALTQPIKSIFVGTGGDLTVIGSEDASNSSPVTFENVPSGTILAITIQQVLATGTTATGLVGLY